MRFLVDGMLGGFSRWLRILGHDVRYEPNTTDNELLRIAEKDNMILLTSDNELSQRAAHRKLSHLLIVDKTEDERLARTARTFRIRLDASMTTSRCPKCGGNLKESSKTDVANEIPARSLMLYDQFWKCRDCGKVYWLGSHWKRICQTLRNATRISGLDQ